jgi:hypothetical protein
MTKSSNLGRQEHSVNKVTRLRTTWLDNQRSIPGAAEILLPQQYNRLSGLPPYPMNTALLPRDYTAGTCGSPQFELFPRSQLHHVTPSPPPYIHTVLIIQRDNLNCIFPLCHKMSWHSFTVILVSLPYKMLVNHESEMFPIPFPGCPELRFADQKDRLLSNIYLPCVISH